MGFYDQWRPYVPVAQRRAIAQREMQRLRKKGLTIQPIEIEGRKITRTFWGSAWCDHLEQFSDYDNRLPRGRTYVRNGSVCHLAISKGIVDAIVSGSELYNVKIAIKTLPKKTWNSVRDRCAGQIGSMLDLLRGHLSEGVMKVVTDRDHGLFPLPRDIELSCSCPDWAVMCKHVAAVLYGVGARLDGAPELLFLLRNVDHEELIDTELDLQAVTTGAGKRRRLGGGQDLTDVFGVEIEEDVPATVAEPAVKRRAQRSPPSRKTTTRKTAGETRTSPPTAKKAQANSRAPSKPLGKSVTRAPAARTARKRSTTTPGGEKKPIVAAPQAPKKRPMRLTSAAVKRLRKRLAMNRSQLARLVGVSPPTVANWENVGGPLNLHQRTADALTQAASLDKDEAWAKMRQ